VSGDETFVEWGAFWTRSREDADWLLEPVIARGRGHAVYAAHKVGKSLFLLWCAAKLATGAAPVVVIYLDFEMTEDDVHERLADMGYDQGTDLSRLRYAVLPTLPALDTAEGACELLKLVDATQGRWPGHDIVVVIDTASRAISGEENSADTIRNFYRHTGLALKQRGITSVRVDHAGKDVNRGARGSSAKGDDVDVVWRLEGKKNESTFVLRKDAARMRWVPDQVPLRRFDDPLSFEIDHASLPSGAEELIHVLDELGLPAKATNREAGAALRDAGQKATNEVIRAAVKYRQGRSERSPEQPRSPSPERHSAHEQQPAANGAGTPIGTTRNATESDRGGFRNSRYGTPQDQAPTKSEWTP
jgi:KaiC/GvpD/RAD55 family RecA-like ATPase